MSTKYDEVKAKEIWGIDFGYNDQCAIVSIKVLDREIPEVYVREHLYLSHLTTTELISKTKKIITDFRRDYSFGDNSRPEIIEEMKQSGINIKPCTKGKNSVKDSIDFLKRHKIFIDKSSTNLIKEMRMYKWKVHSDGRVLDEPVDLNNHLVDALRYATFTKPEKFEFSFV